MWFCVMLQLVQRFVAVHHWKLTACCTLSVVTYVAYYLRAINNTDHYLHNLSFSVLYIVVF